MADEIQPDPKPDATVPANWRVEAPPAPPGQAATSVNRAAVFRVLLLVLVLAAGVAYGLSWLRPTPKPFFIPVWVGDYQFRPWLTTPFFRQDKAALETSFPAGSKKFRQLSSLQTTDSVVVYWAGHARLDEQGQIVLLPSETEPGTNRAYRSFRGTLTALAQSPARHKLLVLDFWPTDDPFWSASIADVLDQLPKELSQVPDARRLVLVSCSPGQEPIASPDLGRTAFNYFFDEGLRGWADPLQSYGEKTGVVTARNLAEYVKIRVDQWSQKNRGLRQTPWLLGEGNFDLAALEPGKPPEKIALPKSVEYPKWLQDAWKTRERWWKQDRHAATPWLFRQMEAALLDGESVWALGGDPSRAETDLNIELDRLEKHYQRTASLHAPEPQTLVQAIERTAKPDPAFAEAIAAGLVQIAKLREQLKADEAAKEAQKWFDDFTLKNKDRSELDWAWSVQQVLVNDPFPLREKIRFLDRLLSTKTPEPRYLESQWLRTLAQLAGDTTDATWPTRTVRKSILVGQQGELAANRAGSFRWMAGPLESAAQKRYEGEYYLSNRGFATLEEAEKNLAAAESEFDNLMPKQNAIEDALKQFHDAVQLLPALAHVPAPQSPAEATWYEAVGAVKELQVLLFPSRDRQGAVDVPTLPDSRGSERQENVDLLLEELRPRVRILRSALVQLQQSSQPAAMEDAIARSRRPEADGRMMKELEEQLRLPLHSGEMRAKLWAASRELGKRLAAKWDNDEVDLEAPVTTPAEREAARMRQYLEFMSRAKRAIAILRLTGSEKTTALEPLWQKAAASTQGNSRAELSLAIEKAWTQQLPQQFVEEKSSGVRTTLSRWSPPWLRLGPQEENWARAGLADRERQYRALWSWLADRYRHAAQDADSPAFYARALFAFRSHLPDAEPAVFLPLKTATLDLNPANRSLSSVVPVRGNRQGPVDMKIVQPDEDWLNINADGSALKSLDPAAFQKPSDVRIPVQVQLKPNAEFNVTPRPLGFFVQLERNGRSYHHKVLLPNLPTPDRLDIVLSADPAQPTNPVGDLRLRPSKEKQVFYVYLRNTGDRARNVTVELYRGDEAVPGGMPTVVVPAQRTVRVNFAKPKEVDPPAELPELTGPLEIRVVDREGSNEIVASRLVRVSLADPREYVRVSGIRFEPPNEANGGKNKLEMTVLASKPILGPPCVVELALPKTRIPGLRAVRDGVFRSILPSDGTPIKLYASDIELDPESLEDGVVYLHIDGVERAYAFKTTFVRSGEPTTPREENRIQLRFLSDRYFRTNSRFQGSVEVDNPPSGSRLEVAVGNTINDQFQMEFRNPKPTAKYTRIGFGLQKTGGLEFEAGVRDWEIHFDALPVRGERTVRARLVDKNDADLVDPIFQRVFFDDHVPEGVRFLHLPEAVKRDQPLLVKATGTDKGVGLKEVWFYLGHPADDGKLPPNTLKFAGQALPKEPDVYATVVKFPPEKRGNIDISVQFVNQIGLSTFAKQTIELLDYDPTKTKPARIEGLVVLGSRPQVGLVVTLYDQKGAKVTEVKTRDGGVFFFENVAPGVYRVMTEKTTSGTPIRGTSDVQLQPGQVASVKLELFL